MRRPVPTTHLTVTDNMRDSCARRTVSVVVGGVASAQNGVAVTVCSHSGGTCLHDGWPAGAAAQVRDQQRHR